MEEKELVKPTVLSYKGSGAVNVLGAAHCNHSKCDSDLYRHCTDGETEALGNKNLGQVVETSLLDGQGCFPATSALLEEGRKRSRQMQPAWREQP